MDDELALALDILRSRLSVYKMAVVTSIVQAEQQGSNRTKQSVKLSDAREWLDREIAENLQKGF